MTWVEIGLSVGLFWCLVWIVRLRFHLHTVAKNTSGLCDVIKDLMAEIERVDNGQKTIAKSVVGTLERDIRNARRPPVNSSFGV